MTPLSRSLIAIASALLIASIADAQVLYKYLGPDGKTVYADKPPPKGVKYQTLQPNTAPTGVDLRPKGGSADSQAIDDKIRERQAKQAEQDEKIAQLEFAYNSAVASLEEVKQIREGDRHMNANGTSRLSEEYLNRVATAEQSVENARQRLEEARRQ